MALTLEDVGRNCGVSRSTVSRVINNSPLVNEATKERVLKAIKEMKYAPNFIARSLTKNRTETLAVTMPDITGGFWPEMLAGVDEIASQHGYHLLVVFLGGPRPKTTSVEELITHRRVDAVLIAASTVDDRELARMAESGVPIVCVAHKSPAETVPSVLFDNAGGAMQATKLLLGQGRKQLIHLRGPHDNFDADERSKGFRNALKEAGIPFDPAREVVGGFVRAGGAQAIRDVLDRGIPFDGIFAANDDSAIGAVEVLTARGVAIPRQVAVVGFDDIDLSRFIGLSTVHVPTREMGRAAARIAFDLIDEAQFARLQVLPTEVVERASTRVGATVEPLRIGDLPKK
jgi:LacI family transcriptional regulator